MAIDIDCDMGEAYSIYKRGDDEAIVPCITRPTSPPKASPGCPRVF